MKLKKLITENEVKTKQPLFTKTFNQICRAAEEFWRFSIERRAGRGSIAGGCCGGVF